MSTTYAPRAHVRWPHVNVWLVAVIGLAAAFIGLGSWVLVDRYTGTGHDATTLIDDLAAAWTAGDQEAIAALYTWDAVMLDAAGDLTVGRAEISGQPQLSSGHVRFERVAPVTVNGGFATTFIKASPPRGQVTFLSVFQLKEGKILRQWDFNLTIPETPPFDNAVR